MRKTLWIIVAIAILGTIAVYAVPQNSRPSTKPIAAGQVDAESQDKITVTVTPTASPTLASTPTATTTPTNPPTATPIPASGLKDGSYTGNSVSNRYGTVQVAISVSGGKITAVNLLSMPGGNGQSAAISNYAGPQLTAATLAQQSANIDTVSGATYTSNSYKVSLQAAIDQAKV